MNASTKSSPKAANDESHDLEISPLSKELVVGLVGYAGAGCSTTAKRLTIILGNAGYSVNKIKLSSLIENYFPQEKIPKVVEGPTEGSNRIDRATKLQDLGDIIRKDDKGYALASLAIKQIISCRGEKGAGESKIAFIIESIKHKDEVELLRRVYDQSFRLVAVHCDRPTRESRLIGDSLSDAKYAGVDPNIVKKFMDRDEKDSANSNGQQVRDAFYLADYFIDNNFKSKDGANITADLKRFAELVLGTNLVRPTLNERAMYHAHAAGLQSACLSRQVGAALVSEDGEVVSTGTNDVPRFGGGIYTEGRKPDSRCHSWEWSDGSIKFKGCHNDRRKAGLRKNIGDWLADNLSGVLAEVAHPVPAAGLDTGAKARKEAMERIKQVLADDQRYLGLPGIKDLIEFSRAIHAEMDALLSAARGGISPSKATLFCTTYPCHSCARHLVTAGVKAVYYIEPYVKSLATDLHSDAISSVMPDPKDAQKAQQQMVVVPFTGVGPRMYEDFFSKRGELKGPGGDYIKPASNVPGYAVRLRELSSVEEKAAQML